MRQADSLTRFARGLGMARSGDSAGAKREIEAMQALQRCVGEMANDYLLGGSHAKSRFMQSLHGWPTRKGRAIRR